MKVGDVIRTRTFRAHFSGPEAKGWSEFAVDRERSPSKKKVFVLMLLGTEPLQCGEDEALDCSYQMNALGYWGENQLVEALGQEKAEELVKKMVDSVKSRKKTEKET